jgi:hypothetical protein
MGASKGGRTQVRAARRRDAGRVARQTLEILPLAAIKLVECPGLVKPPADQSGSAARALTRTTPTHSPHGLPAALDPCTRLSAQRTRCPHRRMQQAPFTSRPDYRPGPACTAAASGRLLRPQPARTAKLSGAAGKLTRVGDQHRGRPPAVCIRRRPPGSRSVGRTIAAPPGQADDSCEVTAYAFRRGREEDAALRGTRNPVAFAGLARTNCLGGQVPSASRPMRRPLAGGVCPGRKHSSAALRRGRDGPAVWVGHGAVQLRLQFLL